MKKILAGIAAIAVIGTATYAIRRNRPSSQQVLNLYIWSDYMDKEVLAQFEKETGIRVNEENYPSNEAMVAKLKAGGAGYDIVVPSDYFVASMAKDNLLAPIDRSKIPNAKHLAAEFQTLPYDPEGKFVIPYMFGTTGIAYNSAKIANPPRTWKDFYSQAALAPLEKRVSLLDDPREVLGGALKAAGLSINSTDPAALAAAKELVLAAKPFVGRIDTMSYKDLLASGDLWLAHSYSGEVFKLKRTNPEIDFLVPEEGGTIWADNLAIPVDAPHKELAHAFIDFVMRPEINAKLAETTQYATANAEARKLIPAATLSNANIYPTEALRSKLEWFADLGPSAEAFDDAWTGIRAGELEASSSMAGDKAE